MAVGCHYQCLSLLPLPFLSWLPAADPQTEIQAHGASKSLPNTTAEVFEPHAPGAQPEQPFLPDLVPGFSRTPVATTVLEEPGE